MPVQHADLSIGADGLIGSGVESLRCLPLDLHDWLSLTPASTIDPASYLLILVRNFDLPSRRPR
jgi:hypothetical protein